MSARFFPQQGHALTQAQSAAGRAMAAFPSGKWKHPWFTTPAWLPAAGLWMAVIVPGFVNAKAPVVRTTIEEQADTGRDFGINPLTGKPFFSDPIFSRDVKAAARHEIEVPLYLAPAIPLNWRAIGFDGQGTVPQFFKDRGAADAPPQPDDTSTGVDVSAVSEVPRGLRLLRVCDLVLHQPRLALTSDITLLDGIATGISNVTQTLSVRSVIPGDVLRIFAGTFAPPSATIDGTAGGLLGVYEEATYDELLISRVYLLSPPGTAPGSEPDGTWQPFVRHSLFWNLNYATPTLRILDSDPGLPFIPPLAAGAAQIVINFLVASINDAARQALNILTAHSLAGTFWTPTGGGSLSAFPAELPPETSAGLNRAERLQKQRIAAARAKASATLDPAFPYVAMPFDRTLTAA